MQKTSFLKDSMIYTIGTFLSKGIAFFLLPFYTRIFTPEDYGILDFIAISISILSLVFSCQMDQGVARFLITSKSIQSKKSYATVGFLHYLIFFGLVSLLIIIFRNVIAIYFLNRPDLSALVGLSGVFMFTEMIYSFFQNQLKWEFKSKHYSMIVCLRVLLHTSLVLFLAGVMHLKLYGVYIGYIIGNLILLAPLYYFTHQSLDIRVTSLKRWKQMLFFSMPLIFSSLAITLFQYCDRFFIQRLISLSELGIYSVGVKIASVTLLLFNGFTLAFGPYVFQNFKRPEAKDNIRKIFNIIFIISGFIILGLSCFSTEILMLLTTQSFYAAHSVIPLIVSSNVLYYLGVDFSVGIALAKKNYYYIYINTIGILINMALNIAWIPRFGIVGAASATFVSLIIVTVASIYLSQRLYPISYDFKKVLILSTWIGVSVYFSGKYSLFSIFWILMKLGVMLGYAIVALFLFKQERKFIFKNALKVVQKIRYDNE